MSRQTHHDTQRENIERHTQKIGLDCNFIQTDVLELLTICIAGVLFACLTLLSENKKRLKKIR